MEVCGETGTILSWERLNVILGEERAAPQPILSRREARDLVAEGKYPVQDGPLLYYGGSDRLLYYFQVEIDGVDYEVQINAVTGEEDWVGPSGRQFRSS